MIILIDFNSDNNFKIPISLDFNSVDQTEIVNREFISIETEKSINPIIDYERVRFTPKLNNGGLVKDLKFNKPELIIEINRDKKLKLIWARFRAHQGPKSPMSPRNRRFRVPRNRTKSDFVHMRAFRLASLTRTGL